MEERRGVASNCSATERRHYGRRHRRPGYAVRAAREPRQLSEDLLGDSARRWERRGEAAKRVIDEGDAAVVVVRPPSALSSPSPDDLSRRRLHLCHHVRAPCQPPPSRWPSTPPPLPSSLTVVPCAHVLAPSFVGLASAPRGTHPSRVPIEMVLGLPPQNLFPTNPATAERRHNDTFLHGK
ncbi:hypothetical protein GUJ93_ZPchr0001g32298 [Zizania palustris]|uniref:Uncharacterized protein n=1 Tax=Zizania palustris TaxID=103762 RepID=A0A8J5SDN0_ZIZPA|nr:hypothetical protein GUJ93_ZPchr0001g32298 [Zizania palustris]